MGGQAAPPPQEGDKQDEAMSQPSGSS